MRNLSSVRDSCFHLGLESYFLSAISWLIKVFQYCFVTDLDAYDSSKNTYFSKKLTNMCLIS